MPDVGSPALGTQLAFRGVISRHYNGEKSLILRWSVLLIAVLLLGCREDEGEEYTKRVPARSAVPPPAPEVVLPMTAADSAAVLALVSADSAALDSAFQTVPKLSAREVAELRLDRNAEQIAHAKRLGTRASGAAEIERLRQQGHLVELEDSTAHWVLRSMEHSVPYVTRDTQAMLVELGTRFHAQLDRLGLPLYRMKITSALRTNETQAELRRTNPNASRTVSAHEFGTTVDVSHERFAVPADPLPYLRRPTGLSARLPEHEAEMLEEIGKEHAKVLQAVLGRTLREMKEEGALLVMMEDAQPVYHMTIARRFVQAR